MLQQAYLARKVSEDSLDSPISYIFRIPGEPTEEEVKRIALHYSDAGYDVFSTVFNKLEIGWAFAEEGRTGIINIRNKYFTFTRNASKK